jgi:RNA recognition motif-containing protein
MNTIDNPTERESDIHTLESTEEADELTLGYSEETCGMGDEGHESPVKLFVGSLPYDINEDDLLDVFTQFGEVREFTILRDRSGKSKGCAALRYANCKAADLCIATLHNKFCCGNVQTPMQVRYFEKREWSPVFCIIDGLPYCFAPQMLWASFASSYGPVSNVYPDAMNPFAAYVSFNKKTSALSLIEDARVGVVSVGGVPCPAARVTMLAQPVMYPFGFYPPYPTTPMIIPPQQSMAPPASPEEEATEDPPVKLFVGCLPYSKTAQDIADLFSPFGDLMEVAILTDFTGKSRGAAFVTFARTTDAKKAVEALKGFSFPKSTRSINISFAYKQNIWKTHFRSSETGTAPSCTSSVTEGADSPINTAEALTEGISS